MITLLVIAICFRLALFLFALQHLPPSSDEACPALMAWHILNGEFPVVYWGQTYMGTQESFIGAALIPIFGFNIVTARLYPLFFGLAFYWVSYLLARKLYGPTVGIVTLAILAIPAPYLAMCGALIPPDNHLALVTLGSLALLVTVDLVFGAPKKRPWWKFVLLGLILGYAFWLHILVLSYIGAALLFLFLRDKFVFLRGEFWIGVFAFCVGSLPLLWYNAVHNFATFTDAGRTVSWARSLELAGELLGTTLHFLVGLKVMLYGDNSRFVSLPGWLAFLLAVIWIGMLLLMIAPRCRSLLKLTGLSIKSADGTGILLTLVAITAWMFCRSACAGWSDVRYILPMISALPILLAVGLTRVRQWSRPVFAVLLLVVIGTQAWGNVLLVRAWNNPRIVSEDLGLPDTAPLFAFLEKQAIHYAYAPYRLSYRMTFESREQLICSEPYNERFPGREVKFIDQVRAATNVAYISHDTLRLPNDFESNLKKIGGAYRKKEGLHFAVYYDFTPPYGPAPLKEISRTGWQVTACRNADETEKAVDGTRATYWHSGQPQATGMWFQVDLGRAETVSKIRFDMGDRIEDYPRGYRLEASKNGQSWQKVLEMGDMAGNLFWEGSHPWLLVKGEFYNAAFRPTQIRYIKITLTGSDPKACWSIAELRMFGPEAK